MHFVFDHVVHFVENPKETIRLLKTKGIHVVEGGEHRYRPTYNVLCYFDLSYIEFLGTSNKRLLEQMDHPKHSLINTIIKDQYTEGFARFIVRTDDMESAVRYLSNEGLSVDGPHYLSRKTPDGRVLEWQLLYIGNEKDELELPYIIQWNEPDENRREELVKKEVIEPDSSVFSHLSIAVRELEPTVKKWSRLFNLTTGEIFIDEELQAMCQTLMLPGGNLIFCSPIGNGVVSEVLRNRGEKPFQVNLSGGRKNEEFEMFGGCYKIQLG